GRIGSVVARIMHGFGCRLVGFDAVPNERLTEEFGLRYADLPELYREADIISLHIPLTPATHHLVGATALGQMKQGVMLINTGRGALVDSRALIDALKRGRVGAAGLDVYEEEEGLFFRDLSDRVLQDDVLARLLTFHNVLITSHQGFLTREALDNIAETTLQNVRAFERGERLVNEVRAEEVLR
ncbi:MAG TPA: NAD(P)-dependent oxidoreductase, partial [Vicinamibacterales bacterium]|nr:NAD(P)-dependent oxidoreductase [Vicinamibacterales bacterium]